MAGPVTLMSLPVEVLSTILSSFNTTALLQITLTSHHFYNIIARILQTRLLKASALKGHNLVVECFHPSAAAFTPNFHVDNLGTGTCDQIEKHVDTVLSVGRTDILGKLRGFYSHFRPILREEDHVFRKLCAGSWGYDASYCLSEVQTEYVCQNIRLESHELFCQLCILISIVKEELGPRVASNNVDIGGGTIRVWRDWLAKKCRSVKFNTFTFAQNSSEMAYEDPGRRLLWVDPGENLGLRVQVIERENSPALMLVNPGHEGPVSYTLQYEELVIRTCQLLFALERSTDQGG